MEFDGSTYDTRYSEYIRTDVKGLLYRQPHLGYFRVEIVGGVTVSKPGQPLQVADARYVLTPLDPDTVTPLRLEQPRESL